MNKRLSGSGPDDKLMCDTISFLRFPLIVCVVFLHTNLYEFLPAVERSSMPELVPFYDLLSYIVSYSFCSAAVPAFFLFAGYLFFRHIETFTLSSYGEKLRRRARSLLIPYVSWNLLMTGADFLQQVFFPSWGGNRLPVYDYSLSDWLYSFWNMAAINGGCGNTFPACPQFWFVRDLMVVILFSPLVYTWVRKTGTWGMLLLVAVFLTGYGPDWVGFDPRAYCFFTMGAYWSMSRRPVIGYTQHCRYAALLLFCMLTALGYGFSAYDWSVYLHRINVWVILVLILGFTSHYLEHRPDCSKSFGNQSTFFVYGSHYLLLFVGLKLCFKYIGIEGDVMFVTLYLLSPFVVTVSCLGLYRLLELYFPTMAKLLTGWR